MKLDNDYQAGNKFAHVEAQWIAYLRGVKILHFRNNDYETNYLYLIIIIPGFKVFKQYWAWITDYKINNCNGNPNFKCHVSWSH